jgi:peptidoglycan/LPS O-acetylase OafA/YrhL
MLLSLVPAAGIAAGSSRTDRRRLVFIDACRGISAATIAAHHLCLYGPLPEAVESLADQSGWLLSACGTAVKFLREHALYAVQIFLVLGGFLQFSALSAGNLSAAQVGRQLTQRFVRLAFPVWAVLAVGLIVHLSSMTLQPVSPLIDPFPVAQLIAQTFFLQDILGYGSLLPGHWYPSIDLQFGLLFVGLMVFAHVCQRAWRISDLARDRLFLAICGAMAVASLFVWNRDSDHDPWVIYYLGSYFLGIVTAAVVQRKVPLQIWAIFVLMIACALVLDFRIRLVVAFGMSSLLLVGGLTQNLNRWLDLRWLTWLGRISYSFFLTHYIVHWVVLSLGHACTGSEPQAAIGWMLLAYAFSLPIAWLFYRFVEQPSMRLAGWVGQKACYAEKL